MNKDLEIIKKHFGEKMMHFCRETFSTLLEQEGLLSSIILNNFESNHFLYEDLDIYGKTGGFKSYIYSLADIKIKPIEERMRTPKELLEEAGYILYECKTEEEIQSFKKYYAKGEEICTFNGGRLNRCHVFFAVKKNVDEIKRENFQHPERQDEYGTSVISIQFTKDSSFTLSIKNRYNHNVANPDATFSNNLDNIISGLTNSFAKHYGMEQRHKNEFELKDYVRAKDGKYYKYNYEKNNIYYCPNNIIIDNFEVKRLEKEKYILIDYFVLDLVEKKITLYDKKIKDGFIVSVPNIKKITIIKNEINKNKDIVISVEGKEDIVITVDNCNNIIGLVNKNLVIAHDYFLKNNRRLTTLELPNLQKVGNDFLYSNTSLTTLKLPNLQEAGNNFLHSNCSLIVLKLPNLQEAGNSFLNWNVSLTTLELPNLQEVGNDFLNWNVSLTTLELPNLQEVGNDFLYWNNSLTTLELPNLQEVGNDFLYLNDSLTTLELPNLKKVGYFFLYSNTKISHEKILDEIKKRGR